MVPSSSSRDDQQEKSAHVLNCIQEHCTRLAQSFDCFQRIRESLLKGGSLRADPLTGGLTNYSYKVVCLEDNNSEVVVLYAKVALPFALWNPDKSAHYDVQRTQKEFDMMKLFADICPNSAPRPFLCEPVNDMMVLVTEWCDNYEQLADQVVEGQMDARVCVGLAHSIARLHCVPGFDPDFNTSIRSTMLSTFDRMHAKLESMYHSTDNDSRATRMVQEMGLDQCNLLANAMKWQYQNSRDCLVHSDLHVKNILVEAGDTFVINEGSFSVVDWEMAFAGPIGRDLGSFFPFLLSCALAHALNGNREGSSNLMNAIDLIWEEYAQGLRQGGKSQEFIDYAFRSTLGWCGRFMFLGYFTAGSHVDDFPIHSDADKTILLDSIGVLGLRLMQWGFDPDYQHVSAAEFRRLFKTKVWMETALLVSLKAQREGKAIPSPTLALPMDCLRSSLRNLLSGSGAVTRLAQ